MALAQLVADDFRCLRHVELALAPRLNLVWGENGAGKTSILEAAFLLGRGRSFRTRLSERLIRQGADRLVVFGRTDTVPEHAAGIEVSKEGGTRGRLDGRNVESLAELSAAVSVQVIDPEIHKLIEQGPERRRRWLDWLVFHVEPEFGGTWSRYTRCLRQRNAALRSQGHSTAAWDAELIATGVELAEARTRVLDRLRPFWDVTAAQLSSLAPSMSMSRGWAQEMSFAEALSGAAERDRQRGSTTVGPHRMDLHLRVHGKPARDVLSRGQQKLVAASMVIAQLKLLRQELELRPLLLLDDPAAELDDSRLEAFVAEIAALDCQMLVTSLRSETRLFGTPDRVFHVEQGSLERV
ncbi:MAG TPA: DNA replication/repair protein RecF [Steroidobacteraceae bacterium]|nr:DNA replication/repair protein RecF [Steroidobacteraceae bacterium]HRX88423.1 DNA replication/repair protein RecF [Steroidobacteraceae bacterium]